MIEKNTDLNDRFKNDILGKSVVLLIEWKKKRAE